ncbi:hypothetical protein MLD38_010424 [Melastoma candidum]|uniref:Uncharacterized protein n=1 Tax=Melastoma candidum TaxID=119954 RepID=A0ACB9R3W6_9MYRT|nr:hypothetical protein MLD38_010424 [Melastoma candidum]
MTPSTFRTMAAVTTVTGVPANMGSWRIGAGLGNSFELGNGYCACWSWNGDAGRIKLKSRRRPKSLSSLPCQVSVSASASPCSSNPNPSMKDSSPVKVYQEMVEAARERFTQEISFQNKDKDITLAKVLLYMAAEDEAFMSLSRKLDAESLSRERTLASELSDDLEWDCLEDMPISGKKMSQWMVELDVLAKEVEVELVSREIGCHLVEVLDAVNLVLFGLKGFKRANVLDSKYSYLPSVLSSRCGNAISLSIIYIEVCRRLGLTIVGSRVGEDFLIWPQTGNPEELFKVTSGQSLFSVVNGRCVHDPKCRASDLTSNSLSGLEIATNRDIIGIALANLIRLHWKRASKRGLMLTSPLRDVDHSFSKLHNEDGSSAPALRMQSLRLAIMATERLLILQPHNWALRRDHGMMLYYNRDYEGAVQELSICMAFAPEEEAEILESFVEKLHLMRLELSWKSMGHADQLPVP